MRKQPVVLLLRRLPAVGLLLGSLEHVLHHLHLQATAEGDGCVAWRPRGGFSLSSEAPWLRGQENRTFEYFGHLGLVGVELEGREEAQGTQVERHDRRHAALQGEHAFSSGMRIRCRAPPVCEPLFCSNADRDLGVLI